MAIPKSVMVELLTNVIATKTTEEKQAAIVTMGKIPLENSQAAFVSLLDQMKNGRLNPDVYLELGEAIDSTHSEALKARYAAISQHFSSDELLASYASSLQGGDPDRGRRIFF